MITAVHLDPVPLAYVDVQRCTHVRHGNQRFLRKQHGRACQRGLANARHGKVTQGDLCKRQIAISANAVLVVMPRCLGEVCLVLVTAGGAGVGGPALLGACCGDGDGGVGVCYGLRACFYLTADRADACKAALLAHGIIGCDPFPKGMRMILAHILLQKCICNCRSHHFMSAITRMHAVTAKFCHVVMLGIHVVHAAGQIQVYHGNLVQGCYLDDSVAEITQRVSVDIGLGLIPAALRSHRIIPGSDYRRQEIELCTAQAVGILKLLNALAPHSHRTVNG